MPGPDHITEQMKVYVEDARISPSFMVRWNATSLERIYVQGGFAAVLLRGSHQDVDANVLGLRVVALFDGRPHGLTTVLNQRDNPIRLARQIRREVERLQPPTRGADRVLDALVREAQSKNEQVLAALEISETRVGERRVQLLYPQFYHQAVSQGLGTMLTFLNISPFQLRVIAGEATKAFLRQAPFVGEPILLQREDQLPEDSSSPALI